MAEAGAQEKTEAPTIKRREDARKEGQVAISREVSSAALLGMFALYFFLALDPTILKLQEFWSSAFANAARADLTATNSANIFRATIAAILPIMVGLFGLAMVVAFLSSAVQVGINFTPLKFKGDRLNPLNGIKRILSSQGAAELFKSLFKMSVIGYVTYAIFTDAIATLLGLAAVPSGGIVKYSFALLGTMFAQVAIALVVLAIFDYLFQRWSLDQRLKMTRQEVKDELKQTEGDPQLRSRIRQVQREMSRTRMMQNVPKADVVVTNPTHYAVALAYDREAMGAPQLVAKGADFIAQRIREIAHENDVPIMENPFVARELFHNVEVGEEIPEEFFRAVAEILAYVYRVQGQRAPSSA